MVANNDRKWLQISQAANHVLKKFSKTQVTLFYVNMYTGRSKRQSASVIVNHIDCCNSGITLRNFRFSTKSCHKFQKKKTLFIHNLQECRMWNGWEEIKYIKFPLTFPSLLQCTHMGRTVNSTPPASVQGNRHKVIIMQLQTSVLCLVLLFLAAHGSHRIVSPKFSLNWVKHTLM